MWLVVSRWSLFYNFDPLEEVKWLQQEIFQKDWVNFLCCRIFKLNLLWEENWTKCSYLTCIKIDCKVKVFHYRKTRAYLVKSCRLVLQNFREFRESKICTCKTNFAKLEVRNFAKVWPPKSAKLVRFLLIFEVYSF